MRQTFKKISERNLKPSSEEKKQREQNWSSSRFSKYRLFSLQENLNEFNNEYLMVSHDLVAYQ